MECVFPLKCKFVFEAAEAEVLVNSEVIEICWRRLIYWKNLLDNIEEKWPSRRLDLSLPSGLTDAIITINTVNFKN